MFNKYKQQLPFENVVNIKMSSGKAKRAVLIDAHIAWLQFGHKISVCDNKRNKIICSLNMLWLCNKTDRIKTIYINSDDI